MTILIDNQQEKTELPGDLERLLEQAVDTGIRETAGPRDVQVSVLIVDDEAIRQMNREFRSVDRSTDVLSFPMLDYMEDGSPDDEQLVHDTDPETGEVLLGDIVLSAETALRQAEEFGHAFRRELGYLAVHGLLHLRGYDHEQERDKKAMREMEERILSLLSLEREQA